MSDHANFNEDASNRTYKAPYTARQPVPNVHEYAAAQGERQAQAPQTSETSKSQREGGESRIQALIATAKTHLGTHEHDSVPSQQQLYPGRNRNIRPPNSPDESYQEQEPTDSRGPEPEQRPDKNNDKYTTDTSGSNANEASPREKREEVEHVGRGPDTREVTDPITHLPVTIHDSTNHDLSAIPAEESHLDSQPVEKSGKQLEEESEQSKREHRGLQKLFPPPSFGATREQLATLIQSAFLFGLGSLLVTSLAALVAWQLFTFGPTLQDTSWAQILIHIIIITVPAIGTGGGLIWAIRVWVGHRIDDIWESQVWEAARTQEQDTAESPTPESTQWLNSILASVWSLINPDLFAGLADTLEDVMQASLPQLVRMVSVEDLGQGSEALRILGIRWLPTGAAAQDVSVSGKIKANKGGQNDSKVQNEGEADSNANVQAKKCVTEERSVNDDAPSEEEKNEQVAEGLEAEEGDFVNMEVAFSYRASSRGKSLKVKSRNAHLFLAFYLPGGIRLRKFFRHFR